MSRYLYKNTALVKASHPVYFANWDREKFNEQITKRKGTYCPVAKPAAKTDCGNALYLYPIREEERPEITVGQRLSGEMYKVSDDDTHVVRYWTAIDIPLEDFKRTYQNNLAQKRYDIEVSGVPLPDGTVIKSDRESQAQVNGAYTKATRAVEQMYSAMVADATDPTEEDLQGFMATARAAKIIDFKAATGWVTLSLEDIEPMVDLIGGFVQACFSREREISEMIEAAETHEEVKTIYDTEVITGWPKDVTPKTPEASQSDPETPEAK